MTAAAGEAAALRPIALLSAAAFCSAASMRAADPLLPQIAQDFAVTTGTASVIATAFSLAYGLCQIVYGPLGDRFGKYRLIAAAMTAATLAVAAAAAAQSLTALAWLRLGAGATAAAVIPLAMAYIGDIVPYEQRQPVLARFLSGQILGLIFGQAAGGMLIEFASWRAVFLLLGGAFALVTAALWLELRGPRVVRLRSDAPLRIGRLVRQYTALAAAPRPRAVLLAVFAEGFLFFGAFAYLGAFLRHAFALDYVTIGLALGGFGLGGLAYSLTARRVVAALGERGMVRAGAALLAVSFAALAWLPAWTAVLPVIVVIGFGFYLFHNTLQTNATQMAPEARGAAVALFAFCFFLGQAAGVALFGVGVDRLGYAPVFATAGIGLLALGAWFARSR